MMQELASNNEALERLLEQPGHQVHNKSKGMEEKIPFVCPINHISDELCYALASITPLLRVSDNCTRDSKAYLEDLFKGEEYAKKSKISKSFKQTCCQVLTFLFQCLTPTGKDRTEWWQPSHSIAYFWAISSVRAFVREPCLRITMFQLARFMRRADFR